MRKKEQFIAAGTATRKGRSLLDATQPIVSLLTVCDIKLPLVVLVVAVGADVNEQLRVAPHLVVGLAAYHGKKHGTAGTTHAGTHGWRGATKA